MNSALINTDLKLRVFDLLCESRKKPLMSHWCPSDEPVYDIYFEGRSVGKVFDVMSMRGLGCDCGDLRMDRIISTRWGCLQIPCCLCQVHLEQVGVRSDFPVPILASDYPDYFPSSEPSRKRSFRKWFMDGVRGAVCFMYKKLGCSCD